MSKLISPTARRTTVLAALSFLARRPSPGMVRIAFSRQPEMDAVSAGVAQASPLPVALPLAGLAAALPYRLTLRVAA